MSTVRQLINGSLRLINVIQANEAAETDDMNISMASLNGMIDSWSTERLNMFLLKQYYFPLVSNQRDYSIGIGGDWEIERPMDIEKITVSLYGTLVWDTDHYNMVLNPDTLDIPVEKLTDAQYAAVPTKNITAPYPLKFYDNGNYPLRTLSMWPIPSTNQPVTIWMWQPLATYETLDANLVFPKGYERALRFNLAVELAPEFGKDIPKDVMKIANDSKATLKRLNSRNQIMIGDIAISAGGPGVYNWNLSTTIPN